MSRGLALYRALLRESQCFPTPMLRPLIARNIREGFEFRKKEKDPIKVEKYEKDADTILLFFQRLQHTHTLSPDLYSSLIISSTNTSPPSEKHNRSPRKPLS